MQRISNTFLTQSFCLEAGAGINHVEALDQALDANKSWESHRVRNGIKAGDYPDSGMFSYAKTHERHVLGKYSEVYQDFEQHSSALYTRKILDDLCAYDLYIEDYGEFADDDHPTPPSAALHNSKD